MEWVLIVILFYGPHQIAMERFPNKESCEQAAKWIKDTATAKTICMKDIPNDSVGCVVENGIAECWK